MDVPVLGDDTLLGKLKESGVHNAFVGVGISGDTLLRKHLFELLQAEGFEVLSTIHPRAVIAQSAKIGVGVTILANAVINSNAVVGDNVIINTGAVVEHDCVIEDHVHIAPNACLAAGVHVGECSDVGMGACIRQNARIGRHVRVGAGAVVLRDTGDNVVLVGVPARFLRATGGA
jgi:UDP-perosamine 4-acetyltransferase